MPGVYNKVTELDAVVAGQLGDAIELQAQGSSPAGHAGAVHQGKQARPASPVDQVYTRRGLKDNSLPNYLPGISRNH